ncbi:MAG: DUF378 domain-containing protein [Patescibacteria group bacterium]
MKLLHGIAFILLLIGGINWGLVGLGDYMLADWNVVNMILGSWPALESIVYILVGLSAVYLVVTHKRDCKMCAGGGMM